MLSLVIMDVVLIPVFLKLHWPLQSTVCDPLGVSEKVTRVSPRQRNVSAQTKVSQDQIQLEPHCSLGPMNPIWHSLVNLQYRNFPHDTEFHSILSLPDALTYDEDPVHRTQRRRPQWPP